MSEATHTCPLCSLRFAGAECHGSCPMAAGCSMIRCPRCSYEFVDDGFVAGLLRRWLKPTPEAGERIPR